MDQQNELSKVLLTSLSVLNRYERTHAGCSNAKYKQPHLSSMLHALRDVTKVGRVFPIPQKSIFN